MSKYQEILVYCAERGYTINRDGLIISFTGKYLSLNPDTRGYLSTTVKSSDGKHVKLHAHRFQAYKKYGAALFAPGICVRHLDGNPKNNSWDNIAIGTLSENRMDIPPEERRRIASSPKHYHKKILNDHKNGMSYGRLMEKYNISSKGTISFIINKSLNAVNCGMVVNS